MKGNVFTWRKKQFTMCCYGFSDSCFSCAVFCLCGRLRRRCDAFYKLSFNDEIETAVPCTSGQLLDALSNEEFNEVVAIIDAEKALSYELTDEGRAKFDEVNSAINEIETAQKDILGQEICENSSPLWGGYIYFDYAEPRISETNYGDFVTDAFVRYWKEYTENQGISSPVVAFENGGGISSALPAGTVTKGDVLNAFNHGNTVVVLKVSPADIYNALEVGLTMSGQDPETGMLIREKVSGSFMQVGGMSYSYSPSGDSGNKVKEVKLADGTVLDRADTSSEILLVTNEYVASGFSEDKKCGELGGEDYLIESYLLEQTENGSKALSMPVSGGRITIADDVSPESYNVSVPVYDSATLGSTAGQTIDSENSVVLKNRVVHISIDGEPSEELVTDENGCVNLTLAKGAHVISLDESTDNLPVYFNNYSGSDIEYTTEGYYRLGFAAPADLPEYVPETTTESQETSSETSTSTSTSTTTSNKNDGKTTTSSPKTGVALPPVALLITALGTAFATFNKKKSK